MDQSFWLLWLSVGALEIAVGGLFVAVCAHLFWHWRKADFR